MSIPSHPLLPGDHAGTMSLAERPTSPGNGPARRTNLLTPELCVMQFSFAAGQELATHSSRRRAWVQILEGDCDFFFDGRWQRLHAGSCVHLPPSHPHAAKASAGPFAMLIVLGSDPGDPAKSPAVQAAPIEVDARGLEPPEPLVRILAALESLPAGQQLHARTDREPCHLFGEARRRGFRHDCSAQSDGSWLTKLERT